MITVIRKKLKSRGFKVILWLTIISLTGLLSLPELIRLASKNMSWAAKVNGHEIEYNDFMRVLYHQEEQIRLFRDQYGNYANLLLQAMGDLNPRKLALDRLIRDALIDQEAQKLGLMVHPDCLTDKLSDFYFLQQWLADLVPFSVLESTGTINVQLLNAYLKRVGISSVDFDTRFTAAVRRYTILNLVEAASYIPMYELKREYMLENLERNFSLLIFSLKDFIAQEKKVALNNDEIKAFFDTCNAQTKRYLVPEKRGGELWVFDPKAYGVHVRDDEIESYYNTHKVRLFIDKPTQIQVRRILFRVDSTDNELNMQEIYQKAQKIREEILADPTTFVERAGDVSDDKKTASNGGLLPFFTRGTYEESFERAAFLLKNDGDISPVIQTSEGFEIVQRVARKQQSFKPLSSVKEDIKKTLLQRKFKEAFAKDAEDLLERHVLDLDRELNIFVDSKRGKKVSIEPVVKDNTKRVQMLFKLDQDEVSFYLDEEAGYIIKTTNIQKQYFPALDSIRSTVVDDMYRDRASRKLANVLEQAKEQAKHEQLEAVAKSFNGKVESLGWIKKEDAKKLDELIKKYAIPTELIFGVEIVGGVATYDGGDYGYLVRLNEMEPFNEKQFTAQQQELLEKLEGQHLRVLADGFVASLVRNATLEINESLLQESEDYSI